MRCLSLSLFIVSLFVSAGFTQNLNYVDLSPWLDYDAVSQAGEEGLSDPLDEDGRRIDAATLPSSYVDGSPADTQDGRTSFLFEPLKADALDALYINGQVIDIEDMAYSSVDLALLAAPGTFGYPFSEIEFRYADGSTQSGRLGPLVGWFGNPQAYDNTLYRYSDESDVNTLFSFETNFGDDDLYYLLQESGNGNNGTNRFIDGTGYALYILDDLPEVDSATLGVTVGNNFVISIATDYWDPEYSTTEGYTVLANSMELYDGFEHRALGNLKQYQFDVTPYLAEGTGALYLLFTDATPSNGWGPYLQEISLFTGEAKSFEDTIEPNVDDSNAQIYAMFQTNGGDEEKPYLYDNSGSGPSNREHRFADGSGSITYSFDLPDDVSDAKLTVDMANNFIVSIAGPTGVTRYDSVTVGSAEENNYLIDDGGSTPGGDYRFADGESYMVYRFDLADDISEAYAQIHVGNQFVVEIASGEDGEFEVAMDWVNETGEETRDNSNLDFYDFDLSPYLIDNSDNIVRFRLSDGIPTDGWGPYLKSITIVNQLDDDGESPFIDVLNSMEMFGEDIHNESNKGYYTIDLAQVLENNTQKEAFVKFTDASTGDGWGPGIFWMAVYSGELEILTDTYVFNGLQSTLGDPEDGDLGLLHRRYLLDSTKILTEIALPEQPDVESDQVYLLGATLNASGADVSDWMLLD
jgi:hypothetical protein